MNIVLPNHHYFTLRSGVMGTDRAHLPPTPLPAVDHFTPTYRQRRCSLGLIRSPLNGWRPQIPEEGAFWYLEPR